MDRAVRVSAYGHGRTDAFAEDHKRGPLGIARPHRFCVQVLRCGGWQLPVVAARERTRPLLLWVPPYRLDVGKVWVCGDLAFDVRRDFGLVTGRVKALCGIRATGKYFPLAHRRSPAQR